MPRPLRVVSVTRGYRIVSVSRPKNDGRYCNQIMGPNVGFRRKKNPPGTKELVPGGFMVKIPAITDFRAKGTIRGLAGLTAVFGMGTGVTPPVWSPEMYPAGGQTRPGTGFPKLVTGRATNLQANE